METLEDRRPTADPSANGHAGGQAEDGRRRRLRNLGRTARGYAALRRTPYGLFPIVLFAFIGLFQRFDSQLFLNGAPDIVRTTGIPVQTVVTVVIFIGFVGLFLGLAVGYYSDRRPRVPVLGLFTILSGIGGMLTGFARSGMTLGIPRVVDDATTDAADVPLNSLVADYYPVETRGRVFSLYGTISRFARLVSLPLSGLLIIHLGLRKAFLFAGAPIVVLGVVALVRLREPVRGYFERRALGANEDSARVEDEPQSFGEAWRTTFAVRTVRRFFVADIIGGLADPADLLLLFLLEERYSLDAFHRGLLLAVPVLFSLAGGYIGGTLLDRFSLRNPGRVLTVFGAFRMLVAFGVIVTAFQPPLVLLAAALCIRYFGFSLVGAAGFTVYSQVIPPAVRTQWFQIANLASVPAFLFAYSTVFAIQRHNGYTTAFLFMVPFLVVSAAVAASAGKFFDIDRRNAFSQAVAGEEWRRARESGKGKLLVCRDVDVAYSGVQVLFGVDFDVEEGEIIALLGTNGAGKSSLLRAISGTQEASGGAIVFDGRDITHMPPHEVAARRVIHMPGGRGVFPELSVRENLMLGGWMTDDEAEVERRFQEVLEIFPALAERIDVPAGILSGGEQQMLSLAQAFLAQPRLLMIDELSLGLSPAVIGQLLDVVRKIHERGVTIIVVEQSVNLALTIAERAIFMEKGEVRFFGRTADLLRRPDIMRAVYVKGTGALTDGAPSGALHGERSRRRQALEHAQPVLEVQGIVKRFGGVTALDGVDLSLREGEVLGVIGPNGSGKTTLFDIISGFQAPDAGRVVYEGVDVTGLAAEERARRKLVRRFQDARLFPSLTVSETLLVALEQKLEVKNLFLGAASLPQARRAERRVRARADKLVELLELGAYRDKFVKELSTGLRRIVDLACVLATEPKVLLLDEPSSGIAQAEAEGLAPLLRRIRFETGCSILVIEHDMPLISSVADELVALERGVVLMRGTADDVLNDERVVQSYLGGSEEAIRRSGVLE